MAATRFSQFGGGASQDDTAEAARGGPSRNQTMQAMMQARQPQSASSADETKSAATARINAMGNFTVEDLRLEFERERLNDSNHTMDSEHTARKEKRLQMKKLRFLDTNHLELLDKPEYLTIMPFHPRVANLVENASFQNLYFLIVTMYAIVMGVELSYDDPKYNDNWFSLNSLFAASFCFEVVCKVYAYGHGYFQIKWFVLEFITAGGSCVTLGMQYYDLSEGWNRTFTCIKLSRILLLGKLFSIRQEFQVIVVGFTRSLQGLYGVFFVVAVICYACTLFVYSVIGKHDYSGTRWEADHEAYFGGIMRTMMTLFSMIIVDEWAGFARPVYFEQPPVLAFFFVFSVMLTMGLLNVVTGMVVDTVNAVQRDHKQNQVARNQEGQRVKLQNVVDVVFEPGSTEITEEEFLSHQGQPELIDMVKAVEFPRTFTLKELFTVLDFMGHKRMTKTQFVDGVMCLIHGTHFQQHCQVLLSLNKVWRDVVSLRKDLRSMHHYLVLQFPSLADDPTALNSGTSDASLISGASDGPVQNSAFKVGFTIEDLGRELENDRLQVASRDLSGNSVTGSQKLLALQANLIDVAYLNAAEYLKKPVAYLERLPGHAPVQSLVEKAWFQGFYFALVTIYSIVMGAELSYDSDEVSDNWFYVNCIFTFLFCIEAVLKLYAYGHKYFRILWFDLEFVTCVSSIVSLGMHYKGWDDYYQKTFTLLKLSRIILLGKLFSMREEFETVVEGFTRSLLNLWGIMFVLCVINYGCTLFCYSVIGKHDYSEYTDYDHDLYWGNIPRTMITMFSMMITDNWGGYARIVWEEQPPVILFFYIYTVLLTWGLLNVVTGMIVETVNRVREDHDKVVSDRKTEFLSSKLMQVVEMLFIDTNGDGICSNEITEDEFIGHANKDELIDMLEGVDFPHTYTLRDFFIVLDDSGQKQVTKENFVDGTLALMNGSQFHRDCQILLSTHKVRRGIVGLRKELRTIHHKLRASSMVSTSAISKSPLARPGSNEVPDETARENRERLLTVARMGEIKPLILAQPTGASTNPWEQLRSTLQVAAMQHAKEELQKRWEELEWEYKAMDPVLRRQHCVMPSLSSSTKGSQFSALQEQYFVWNKLSSAISRESLYDLRQALDHARDTGLTETSSAFLFTYCDALTRHRQTVGFTLEEVLDAIAGGSYDHAISMVLEMAIAQGADRNLLLNALTRLCVDSTDRGFATTQSPGSAEVTYTSDVLLAISDGRVWDGQMEVFTKPVGREEMGGNLLIVLQAKAAQHARHELNRAWDELDNAYALPDSVGGAGGAKGNGKGQGKGKGPGYSPFSRQEEHFFIRNQLVNSIQQESLPEVRRALTYAMAFGIDPKNIEIEAAYRDALAKTQMGDSFNPKYVKQVLETGDWWSALDLIIGAALQRGADKNILLKMIGRVCMTSQFTISMPIKSTTI